MKKFLSGAALAISLALVAPAMAAPGQCSMTGFDEFPCDVSADGGGLTFELPNGSTLVFAQVEDGEGPAYLVAANAEPGDRPQELGQFAPAEGQPGCWFGGKDDITFCAAIEQ